MFSIISSIFGFFLNVFYECILYIFVDVLVKTFLKEANDEKEKRSIWFCESMVLLGICFLLYLFHHTPYLLLLFTSFTLVYTQLIGRVNFRYWWFQLATRWDEFQQLEESMEQYNEMQSLQFHNPQHPPPNVQAPTHTQHWLPQNAQTQQQIHLQMQQQQQQQQLQQQQLQQQQLQQQQQQQATHANSIPTATTEEVPQYEAWYPADATPVTSSTPPQQTRPNIYMGPTNSTPVSAQPTSPGLRQRISPIPANHHPAPIYSSPQMMPRFQPMMSRPDLARRPLHSYLASPSITPKPKTFSSSLKSKVMSVFGLPEPANLPPGMKNGGANLCFLNSVMQCLANSPGLAELLQQEIKNMTCSTSEAAFVLAISELFNNLRMNPVENEQKALDPLPFREAACQLRGSVVLDPLKGNQEQQDVGEFLMWTLDVLHNSLNLHRRTNNNQLNNVGQQPMGGDAGVQQRYPNMSLNMLRFIYGDLTPQRIHELKLSCRKEIEQANGVDNESYAEPIQRLSDLEWLSYKEHNCSVIDDMFNGQLVEAQHCLACNRVSVGIQTFSILPVPIVEPRQLNGLVYLEDCFTKFGNIEDLFGADGLRCDNCNRETIISNKSHIGSPNQLGLRNRNMEVGASPALTNGGRSHTPIHPQRQRLLTADSAVGGSVGASPGIPNTPMSPIPNIGGEVFNDSGFHDNHLRTSTPISAPIAPSVPVKLTDGQRRSLLRQLPECLVVQLMRFSVSQGIPKKIQRPVSVPLLNLDLTHQIIDNVMRREDLTALHASFKYNLYAMCVHLGGSSTSYGHYVSYAKGADNTWYRYDDENVQPVNMEYELNTKQVRENAYLLFYRKCL